MNKQEIINDQYQLDATYITYTVKIWRLISAAFNIIILFAIVFYFLVTDAGTVTEKTLIFSFMLLPGGLLAYIFNRYLACRNQVLQVTEANDDPFYFSDQHLNKYNKNDIELVTIYQPGGVKKLHYFYVYEITFKDGSMIKFSNMLISEADVLNNFPDDLIRYGNKSPFWLL